MKKKIAILLVGAMTLSLTGCSNVAQTIGKIVGGAASQNTAETTVEETVEAKETEEETKEEVVAETVTEETETETETETTEKTQNHTSKITELSDDIYDFQVKINGEVYQVPMWYADLTDMGWTCGDDDTQTLASNGYDITKFTNEDGVLMRAYVVNFGVNTLPYTDCEIGQLGIAVSDNKEKDLDVELPKGIKMNEATYDDVVAAYGNPSDEFNGDLYDKLEYKLDFYNYVSLYIYKESGVLQQVEVENMEKLEGADTSVSDAEPECVSLYEAPTSISDDPFEYEVEIAGDYYKLPCPVTEFLDNGWKILEADSAEFIAGSDYDWITLQKDNQKENMIVRNYDENAVQSKYAFVTDIEIGEYSMDLPMTICGGISIGDDASKVEEFFDSVGCHFEKYDGSSYIGYTAYEGDFATDKYYIVARDGKVDKISVSFTPRRNELYQ